MGKTNIKTGIGYSPISDNVYLGRIDEERRDWIGKKTNITSMFIDVAMSFFSKNSLREITANGKIESMILNIEYNKEHIEKAIKMLEEKKEKLKE